MERRFLQLENGGKRPLKNVREQMYKWVMEDNCVCPPAAYRGGDSLSPRACPFPGLPSLRSLLFHPRVALAACLQPLWLVFV